MKSFLQEVVDELYLKYDSLEELTFILPSKRAGAFLKNILASTTDKTVFSPDIFSIEGFVEKISGLTYAPTTELLFRLYRAYLKVTKGERDNFYIFSKWGQTLLQDFNEIDRYLIDTSKLFSYITDIQEISHWSLQGDKTKMVDDYIEFWKNLEPIYTAFTTELVSNKIGHQGLVYREACNQIDNYVNGNESVHIFIGFNALNAAETKIIQKLLSKPNMADIYWDIDECFFDDKIHDAGYFIRQHKNAWNYFQDHPVKGISSFYETSKNIHIIGVPKNVSQAKYVGNLLQDMEEGMVSYTNTAVVLGDETLMNPILNAIPKTLDYVNITMGYPLGKTPLASMFHLLFELHATKTKQGWYYKNVLDVIAQPSIQRLLNHVEADLALKISNEIKVKNLTFITIEELRSLAMHPILNYIFISEYENPKLVLDSFIQIILHLKPLYEEDSLHLEYLYRFYTLFLQLTSLIEAYTFVNEMKSIQSLYKELLSSETLDFQGEPLKGLQIMGMLESRNLDFETVIITSVNEGILPSGKSNNSFISFDVKKAFGLPTYKEKDAVYTYHFYRLLQRAKNVYLIYNTEPDVLEGGEKSRLISQIITDDQAAHNIVERIATPSVRPTVKALHTVKKDESLLAEIKLLAANGFSPTTLTNYIRNPIEFYKKSILGIQMKEEVEENVAHNTFGTIIHDTLEDLYTPFIGEFLTKEIVLHMRTGIQKLVQKHFEKSYLKGDISRGKNLIAFNVVIQYLETFIALEAEEVEKHRIKILGLEEKRSIKLVMPQWDFPIYLKGKLDRIDERDGVTRIIDYKTGKVEQRNVTMLNGANITEDYENSKAFQLLCYALMHADGKMETAMEAGIISFKNLSAGVLKFGVKETKTSRTPDTIITKDTLNVFEAQLCNLISEICTATVPFKEKEL